MMRGCITGQGLKASKFKGETVVVTKHKFVNGLVNVESLELGDEFENDSGDSWTVESITVQNMQGMGDRFVATVHVKKVVNNE